MLYIIMLGIHVTKQYRLTGSKKTDKKRETLLDAIQIDTKELNINTIQIFTHGPRNTIANNINYQSVEKYCKLNDICIFVHSSYITNPWKILCGTLSKLSKAELTNRKTMLKHIKDQLITCHKIGAKGLVVHLPKYTENAIYHICDIMQIIEPFCVKTKIPILLEVEAHKPAESFAIPEHLNELCKNLNECLKSTTWGIVLDTAHIWASEVDIRTANSTIKWLNKITYQNKIKLIHLNGSPVSFGSNKDMHAIAFSKDDKIWKTAEFSAAEIKNTGAYKLIKFCKKNNIPMICEINRGLQNDAEQSLDAIKHILNI
jgi:endonuclease IV